MASPVEALETAIYAKMNADTGAGGVMKLATWAGPLHAPKDTAFPYVTYELVEAPEQVNMLSRRGWLRFRYRFVAHTAQSAETATNKATGQAIIARVITLFDRVALTISGYTHIASLVTRPYADGSLRYGGAELVAVATDLDVWVQ